VKYPVRFVSGTADEIIVGNGDSELLVAPVHVQGATSREVQLPEGSSWINYWTGKAAAGGTSASVSAPIDRVPIFVKAGSIIPMGPEIQYVDEKPADRLTLDIYPLGKSSYTLYEDDGKSKGYQQGKFARTQFTCAIIGGDAIIDIGAAQGDYEGKLASRNYILKVNRKADLLTRVSRNGAPIAKLESKAALDSAAQGWFNDIANATVWVKFQTATAIPVKIVLNGLNTSQ
jgi:hypothetical protein